MPEEERRKIPQNNLGVKKKIPFELAKERLRGLRIMGISICG